jgi:hypothetical protein
VSQLANPSPEILRPNRFQVHRTGHPRSHSERFHKSGTAQAVRCRNSQIPRRRSCAQTAFKSTVPDTLVRTANASIKAERRKPSGVATRKSFTGELAPNRFQVHRTGHPRSQSEPFHKSGTAQAVRCRNSQILHRRSCAQPLSSPPYRSAKVQAALTKIRVSKAILSHHHPVPQACIG